jgi:hypothetical protein
MNKSNTLWILATCIVVIGVIIYIVNGISNETSGKSNRSETSYNSSSGNSNYSSNSYSSSSYNHSTTNNPTYSEPIRTKSKYKGNQLSNGSSPLDGCFGKGRYAGQAWITFKNSNVSDAIVCLVRVSSGKTIRNEYIRAGTNFTMNQIPSGTYYLKVYYGNDWNPTKENFCGTTGAFDSDEHFSKSDNYSDYIEVENSEYSYTTGEITLYTVANGNMSSERMSASEFFSN